MEEINRGEQPVTTEQDAVSMFTMTNGNSFVADGPLARAYGEALDQLYRKEVDPATGIVLEEQAEAEKQAEDTAALLATKDRSLDFANAGNDVGMLYGVKRQQTSLTDLNRIVDSVSQMSDGQKNASAVILDTDDHESAQNNLNTGDSPLAAALEMYCKDNGVMVYRSLSEFIKRHGV